MEKELRILLLEDSLDDVALIEHQLKKEGIAYVSQVVDFRPEYEKALEDFCPDVVVSDHSLPQFNSLQALELYHRYKEKRNPSAAFVLVTGTVSEEFAVEVMQKGADDYVLKDRLKRLPSAIYNALEKNRLKEQRRKVEEEKLQLLEILQKSLHEIYVFDPETLKFLYVNEEGKNNLGYSEKEISNMTPVDFIVDFDEERFRRILGNAEMSLKGRIYEQYAIRKDGSTYPIQIHLQLVEQGDSKKFVANVLDITETKEHQQQKELALFIQNCFSEDQSLAESLQIILQELCTRSNLPAGAVWSRDFDEMGIKSLSSWKEEKDPDPKAGQLLAEKVFETGTVVNLENLKKETGEYPEIDQETFYKSAKAYPIKSGREITAVLIFYSGTTFKKKEQMVELREGVQDKLASNIKRKKTEEELQKIFTFSPDVLAVIGEDGFVKKINPSMTKILGYSEEEILSTPFANWIHPDDLPVLQDWKKRNMKDDEVEHYESRWKTVEGNYRWFAWSVTPYLKGRLQFAVGKDITDHKKKVAAIEKQNEKLAAIAWEQSHVVRAPLARLLTCVEFLKEMEEGPQEILSSIRSSAYEIDDIIKGIIKRTEKIEGYGKS